MTQQISILFTGASGKVSSGVNHFNGEGQYSVHAELDNGEAQGAVIEVGEQPAQFGFMFSDQ